MKKSDKKQTLKAQNQRNILEMSNQEAKVFLLKPESYSSIELPPYFCFAGLLKNVSRVLDRQDLSQLRNGNPRDYEDVNHLILNNKDGKYAWRPLQLIHPAIYVSLVNKLTLPDHWNMITQRLGQFSNLKKIKCLSLPVESSTKQKDKAVQIMQWWNEIEQKSIKLALEYEYVAHADITNCYGSIYTHSIAWAIHGKPQAKRERRNQNIIGNIIDSHIQDMSYGQTNGIPQGSVLMDLIAELVLGYADLELAEKIEQERITDYLILRYRDDYRVFVNNPQDAEKILKHLTEELIDLGLKLNANKTKPCNVVICEAIKPDKLSWMTKKNYDQRLQRQLLIIHNHSIEYPNSGSVERALSDYYRRLVRRKTINDPMPLISIVVDIAFRSPRTYPICSAILSKLLKYIRGKNQQKDIVEKILKRFFQIPNTGHMDIWLQRISKPYDLDVKFREPLCQLVDGHDIPIWNNDWISSRMLKNALASKQIINKSLAKKIKPIIPIREVELFMHKEEYY